MFANANRGKNGKIAKLTDFLPFRREAAKEEEGLSLHGDW